MSEKMLEDTGTYILSIEGKDIINAGSNYQVKKYKKYKATLDYSLEAIQLSKVAQSVYKKKKDKNIFFIKDDKQYTKTIVSLSFNYAVKEFYDRDINKQKIYLRYDSGINDINELKAIEFINGLRIIDNNIIAIQVNVGVNETDIELPKGFYYAKNKDEEIVIVADVDNITTITTTSEVRKKLYKDGFHIQDETGTYKMVRFKRSSGASREGKCLFINEKFYKDMMEWSMMGLKYKESDEIDLAAIEAYIALTTSSIIDTIEIDPKSILLIDDDEIAFTDKAMVTRIIEVNEVNGEKRLRLSTRPEDEVEIKNNIWDGQSLLDSSVYGTAPNAYMYWVDGRYVNKGMLLLRNRFFKSACFNTNIQKFFADNGITEIFQLNGRTLATDIKDIKMITTKSSIKYLKFASWEDFVANCTSTWGIVKYEKPTHFFDGNLVQTHYQLLNTLQMSNDQVRELLQPSFDYLKLLKNDIRVLRNHLGIKIQNDVKAGEFNSTDEMMFTLLQVNDDFDRTDLFINFKADLMDNYIKNMQQGHILIPGNYSVLFGNGLEMLKATIKDKNHPMAYNRNSELGIDEIHCKNFKYNQRILGCRSPHVTMGNLLLVKNVESNILDEYFNLSNEIVCVNSINNNILERLSSSDFDSDALILTDMELLIDITSANYKNFLVPTSKCKPEPIKRLNNADQKAELDIKTSGSSEEIGEIINCSQILNSKLWDMVNKGEPIKSPKIQELYAIISQLDVMSCISIDSAKKEFPIDLDMELEYIKNKYLDREIVDKKYKPARPEIKELWQEIKELKTDEQDTKWLISKSPFIKDYQEVSVRPKFFKIVGKGKEYYFKPFETTMDYLEEIIKKETKDIRAARRQGKGKEIVSIYDLLCEDKTIMRKDANRNKIKELIKDCNKLKTKIAGIWANEKLTGEEKYTKSNAAKNDFISKVAKQTVTPATIKSILWQVDQELKKLRANKNSDEKQEVNTSLTGIARDLVSILYKAHKRSFVALFNESKKKVDTIKRVDIVEEGVETLQIYGMNYIIVK